MPPIPGVPGPTGADQTDLNPPRTREVDVIIPPAEIRKIADKTAEYVAKNGSAFEQIVAQSESNNPKFSFMKPNDPYRAYFEQKVIEFAKGLNQPEKEEPKPEPVAPQITQKKDIKKEIRVEVRPPPADRFTVEPPTSLTVLDMDVIKLTAQFVAKNGQKFLIALTEREKQNPQFDFLKPTHQLFSFFTNLVDAYSKCANPTKVDVIKLQQFANDKMAILNAAGDRFTFESQQTQTKKKKEDVEEEERAQMAQIDWNEFVVVETIDLFDDEELPNASNFARPDAQPLAAQSGPVSRPVSEQISTGAGPNQYMPGMQAGPGSELSGRKAVQADNTFQKCPVCGRNIPVSEFNEHLRIEMLDPNYRNVKADAEARAQNITTVSGDDIAKNLKAFARHKPDVFGHSDEQQRFQEQQAGKVIWDGQSGTMTRTTANMAMIAQQQKRNYDDQFKPIQDLGLNPKNPQTKTAPGQVAGPFLPGDRRPDIGGMEGTKKVRTDLFAEEMWLIMNPNDVTVKVQVPNIGNISSKVLTLQFGPKTSIGAVKQALSGQLGGLPAGDLKLTTKDQRVLSDGNSLAYYNIADGSVFELGIN